MSAWASVGIALTVVIVALVVGALIGELLWRHIHREDR
jgi:ABC-type spermidine/putrescine transport system permease subunit II